MSPSLVDMRGITVSFGGSIIALRDVDFHVRAGEVVALLRDNGAGKSTLIKVLSGVQRPQSGSVWFSGEQVTLSSPQHARRLGVETVYQDLALIPLMSSGAQLLSRSRAVASPRPVATPRSRGDGSTGL